MAHRSSQHDVVLPSISVDDELLILHGGQHPRSSSSHIPITSAHEHDPPTTSADGLKPISTPAMLQPDLADNAQAACQHLHPAKSHAPSRRLPAPTTEPTCSRTPSARASDRRRLRSSSARTNGHDL
ncbi:hypothetical protein ACLOJK_034724 [Asimina triloba]